MGEWKSISEHADAYGLALVYRVHPDGGCDRVDLAWPDNRGVWHKGGADDVELDYYPTHWMELPPAPRTPKIEERT